MDRAAPLSGAHDKAVDARAHSGNVSRPSTVVTTAAAVASGRSQPADTAMIEPTIAVGPGMKRLIENS